jgi:hypothetical protein
MLGWELHTAYLRAERICITSPDVIGVAVNGRRDWFNARVGGISVNTG